MQTRLEAGGYRVVAAYDGEEALEKVESEKPDLAHVHNVFPLITPSIYIALEEAGIPYENGLGVAV